MIIFTPAKPLKLQLTVLFSPLGDQIGRKETGEAATSEDSQSLLAMKQTRQDGVTERFKNPPEIVSKQKTGKMSGAKIISTPQRARKSIDGDIQWKTTAQSSCS